MRTRTVLAAAGAGLCLAAALLLTTRTREPAGLVVVTVRSDPSPATVFEGNRQIGFTPFEVELRADERRVFRLVHRNRADAHATLRRSDFPRSGLPAAHERCVELAPLVTASLNLTSDPSGAEVVLDGRREGRTPLLVDGLAAGEHVAQLTHPQCFPWRRVVSLKNGECLDVDARLEDRVVALYRDMIEKEPYCVTHYSDLAHHHILKGQWEEAERLFRKSYDVACQRRDARAGLFFDELVCFYQRMYVCPDEEGERRLRRLARELTERGLREGVWPAHVLQLRLRLMDQYDRTGVAK